MCTLALAFVAPLGAQQPNHGTTPLGLARAIDATAGSPTERSLLILSLLERERFDATLRPISRSRAETLARVARGDTSAPRRSRLRFDFSAPVVNLWHNTGFAHADQDGAVWQGRGLTASISGGVVLGYSIVSLSLRPLAFQSRNARFALFEPPRAGKPYATPFVSQGEIDLPVRFGDRAYGRLDPGESWLRIGPDMIGAGFTAASEQWGPAHFYPLVWGTEAAGFPRLFVETRRLPLWIGRVTTRWTLGRLEPSPFGHGAPGERSRLSGALMGSFQPGVFPGMELGVARFFHVRLTAELDPEEVAKLPLRGLLKDSNPTNEGGSTVRDFNQLASVFVRFAPEGAGVEVYTEFYREDHNSNARDLAVMPDHNSAWMLGMRRVWRSGAGVSALTIECTNGRMTHLDRVRDQGSAYMHGQVTEGHTFRGQLLGSTATLGGDGRRVGWERIGRDVTWSLDAEERLLAQDSEGGHWRGEFAGLYSVRVGTARRLGTRSYGGAVTLMKGFGLNKDAGASFNLFARGLK